LGRGGVQSIQNVKTSLTIPHDLTFGKELSREGKSADKGPAQCHRNSGTFVWKLKMAWDGHA